MRKFKTVDEYIKMSSKETQPKLREIRKIIKSAVPDALEGIKYGMPGYSYKRILVIFGGFKNHIGFYPTPSAVKFFSKYLEKYKTAPGSIQFPLDKPLPVPLIKKITKFRAKEALEQDGKWKTE